VSGPVFLVPDHPNHEVGKVLEGLLSLAAAGELNGIVFGVSLKGQRYYCDAAGALHRSPIVGLGVTCMLKTELERRMRHQPQETIF
jgi:hypothetical protein